MINPTIYIQIYDISKQEIDCRFYNLKDIDVILLFYDVTRFASFKLLEDLTETINNIIDLKEMPIILVADKIDKKDKRIFSKKKGLEIAEKNGFKYFECSSSLGLNVYEILNELILEGYNVYCNKKYIEKIPLKLEDNDLIHDDTNNKSSTCYNTQKKVI